MIETIASKFRDRKFLYITEEDIEQEVRRICYEAIKSFDKTKGASIQTYLTRCVSNRLMNLKRDKYFRFQNPCRENRCQAFDVFTGRCIFPKEYAEVCLYRKNSDSKMQRQIAATNYVSIHDTKWEENSCFVDDTPEIAAIASEIREEIVRCSGESFGLMFDDIISGRREKIGAKQLNFIQCISSTIMFDGGENRGKL